MGRIKNIDVEVETRRWLTEFTGRHHTSEEAHSPVRWSSLNAFVLHEVNVKCADQLGKYGKRQDRENTEPKKTLVAGILQQLYL